MSDTPSLKPMMGTEETAAVQVQAEAERLRAHPGTSTFHEERREATPMDQPTLRYIEYEPRWHGWARWTLRRESPGPSGGVLIVTLQEGWKRRPRGSQYFEIPADAKWRSQPIRPLRSRPLATGDPQRD